MENIDPAVSSMHHHSLSGGGAGKKKTMSSQLFWFPRMRSKGETVLVPKNSKAGPSRSLSGTADTDTVLGDMWDLRPLHGAGRLPLPTAAGAQQPISWEQYVALPGATAVAAAGPTCACGAFRSTVLTEFPADAPKALAQGGAQHAKPLGARRLVHQILEVLCLVACLALGLVLLYTLLCADNAASMGPARRIMLERDSREKQADEPMADFKASEGEQSDVGTSKGLQESTEATSSSLPAMVIANIQKSIKDTVTEQSKLHRAVWHTAGKQRSIIATQVNVKGKVKVTKWYEAARKAGHSKKVHFIADDNASYKHLKETWPTQTVHFKDFVHASPPGSFDEPVEADTESPSHDLVYLKRRPKYLKALITLNVTVLFTELDYPWREDPLSLVPKGLDIGAQEDSSAFRKTTSRGLRGVKGGQRVR